jgi:hypothetical protein
MRRSRLLDPLDLIAFGDGQAFRSPDYVWSPGNVVTYRGARPQSCWCCGGTGSDGHLAVHAHGFLQRELITLRHGLLVRIKLLKMRWWCPGCGATSHNRPPDELPRVKVCTLCVVVFLYAVLVYAGLRWPMVLSTQEGVRVSTRTVVRWRERAAAKAGQTLDSIRKAVGMEAGLEPEESHLGSGLSPPEWLLRRPWSEPGRVSGLWHGIQLVLTAHRALNVQCADILARARGLTGTASLLF